MNPFQALRRYFANAARSTQLLAEIREGVANSANQSSQRLAEVREGVANLTDVVARRLGAEPGAGASIQLLTAIRGEVRQSHGRRRAVFTRSASRASGH